MLELLEASVILSKRDEEWYLVNVANTLHLKLHGWPHRADKTSPYYVIHETSKWISVNWVHSPNPQLFNFQNNGVNIVKQVLAFIQKRHEENKKILVTCDQGLSRSPSIALLYLARISQTIPATTFFEAYNEFVKIYPLYQPGEGIKRIPHSSLGRTNAVIM